MINRIGGDRLRRRDPALTILIPMELRPANFRASQICIFQEGARKVGVAEILAREICPG